MSQALVRVGTRGSKLALIQTRAVMEALRAHWPGIAFEERVIKTTGDRVADAPLSQIGTRGLFTKEIEAALLQRDVDLAVHSAKDVPTTVPDGLRIEIICEREDPRDVLVTSSERATRDTDASPLDALPDGAIVGTSSQRRGAQLLHHRPDLRIVPLRGNLDTRLRKLETERLDAIVVAAAGLARIGADAPGALPLPISVCVPAAGQGALAVELRLDDEHVAALVAPLRHEPTSASVAAERAALAALGSGCQVPIGLHACLRDGRLRLQGVVAHPAGTTLLQAEGSGDPGAAEQIGADVARELVARGARDLMSEAGDG